MRERERSKVVGSNELVTHTHTYKNTERYIVVVLRIPTLCMYKDRESGQKAIKLRFNPSET